MTVSIAETAEPIELPSWGVESCSSVNHMLDGTANNEDQTSHDVTFAADVEWHSNACHSRPLSVSASLTGSCEYLSVEKKYAIKTLVSF